MSPAFWHSAFEACAAAQLCSCGHASCPAAPINNPHSRAIVLVRYARRRNHDAIRLRRSREMWAANNRTAALDARAKLIRLARECVALARCGGAS